MALLHFRLFIRFILGHQKLYVTKAVMLCCNFMCSILVYQHYQTFTKSGDPHYSSSTFILIGLAVVISILSILLYVYLTSVVLNHRVKELAIKKIAGTGELRLWFTLLLESFAIVGFSLFLSVWLLFMISGWLTTLLGFDPVLLLVLSNSSLVLIIVTLSAVTSVAPLYIMRRFTKFPADALLNMSNINYPWHTAV